MNKNFNYVKNQVILGNFNTEDLLTLVARNIISEEERLQLFPILK